MRGSPEANENNARLSSSGGGRVRMKSVFVHNAVRKLREELLMSRAELARNAGISPLTVDRIEKGMSCRIETKRKIILAFGYDLSDKGLIFKNC
jgi:DNA-binding XRE family transcriptional regulator